MSEETIKQSHTDRIIWILGYEILFMVIAGSSLIINRYVRCFIDNKCIDGYKYFSTQGHYMVFFWYLLAILWRNNPEKMNKLTGKVHGGIALYATIISVIYTLLLAHAQHGIDIYTNLVTHYISPWFFVIHFFLVERKRLEWKNVLLWLIYPILYCAFALIYSVTFTNIDPIYFFVDLNNLSAFAFWFPVLIVAFVGVGSLYTFLNHLIVKSNQA